MFFLRLTLWDRLSRNLIHPFLAQVLTEYTDRLSGLYLSGVSMHGRTDDDPSIIVLIVIVAMLLVDISAHRPRRFGLRAGFPLPLAFLLSGIKFVVMKIELGFSPNINTTPRHWLQLHSPHPRGWCSLSYLAARPIAS